MNWYEWWTLMNHWIWGLSVCLADRADPYLPFTRNKPWSSWWWYHWATKPWSSWLISLLGSSFWEMDAFLWFFTAGRCRQWSAVRFLSRIETYGWGVNHITAKKDGVGMVYNSIILIFNMRPILWVQWYPKRWPIHYILTFKSHSEPPFRMLCSLVLRMSSDWRMANHYNSSCIISKRYWNLAAVVA